jgi:hypothetical protein
MTTALVNHRPVNANPGSNSVERGTRAAPIDFVEFKAPGSFTPVTDMVGGGPFHLKAGQWTDDTSMALCLATSLAETERFDPQDQMERYARWWRDGFRKYLSHLNGRRGK